VDSLSKKNSIGKSTLLLLVTYEATNEQYTNTLLSIIILEEPHLIGSEKMEENMAAK
jgi:hypothetical protein